MILTCAPFVSPVPKYFIYTQYQESITNITKQSNNGTYHFKTFPVSSTKEKIPTSDHIRSRYGRCIWGCSVYVLMTQNIYCIPCRNCETVKKMTLQSIPSYKEQLVAYDGIEIIPNLTILSG